MAEETLREISWSELKPATGVVIEPNVECNFAQLKIQNTQWSEEKTFEILTISDPCITSNRYALTGKVKYEHVPFGFLEMWNYFPDGKAYFSRTLGNSVPVGTLSGSSDWRSFMLPFNIGKDTKMRPTRLELNVVLTGPATVYLGPLKLVQFEKEQTAGVAVGSGGNAWWTGRTGGLIGGGVGGSVIGIIGAVIGILTSLGTGRRICLCLLGIMFVFGLVVLALGTVGGLVALGCSQPYAVWYPLLMLGVVLGLPSVILPLALLSTIKRQYEQRELRKMHAMDVR
jgi:hypothetical protein